jgi:hypothetical protein
MRQPTKLFLIVLLCTALYSGAMAAGKSLMSDAEVRKTYAESMNTNPETLEPTYDSGVAFFTTLAGNKQFDIALSSPSTSSCDAVMDFLIADQTFLQDLYSRKFSSIGCVRYKSDGTTTIDVRAIKQLVPPPARPESRPMPSKHDPRPERANA